MKILSYILILTGMLFFGCSSISVTSDYDPASNFTGYKTFAVSEKSIEGSALEQAPLIKKRVVDAVKSEMRKKGMVATHEDKADLVVYPFECLASRWCMAGFFVFLDIDLIDRLDVWDRGGLHFETLVCCAAVFPGGAHSDFCAPGTNAGGMEPGTLAPGGH